MPLHIYKPSFSHRHNAFGASDPCRYPTEENEPSPDGL